MKCPKCGSMVDDNALMCGNCFFHFDEPYEPQIKKKHSVAWWLIVVGMICIGLTILTAFLLEAMVKGFG
jgi:hypothetical protein